MSDCCCETKHTPRSDELKTSVTRRINRAVGQLNGIKQMVEDDRYCADVLVQLAAVEQGIPRLSARSWICSGGSHDCRYQHARDF